VAGKVSTVEATLAEMAGRSHGVVTRAQLLAAGITRDEIDHRLSLGALLREHRGVYRVGHRAPSVEARYLAAVWACGDDAVLSGRAAAHLWGILKGAAPAPEVTAHTERRVHGLTTHRARHIERTTHRGIPITTVPRTLVDLAAHLPSMPWQEPATRPGSSTTPRHARSKPCSRRGHGSKARRGCAR
jgi:hypothetical protein